MPSQPHYMQAMLAQKKALTPKKGFNLVGLDDYEEPGDQLFLIGSYDTHEEAVKAEKDHNRRNKDVRTYIYGASDAKESVTDTMRRMLEEP